MMASNYLQDHQIFFFEDQQQQVLSYWLPAVLEFPFLVLSSAKHNHFETHVITSDTVTPRKIAIYFQGQIQVTLQTSTHYLMIETDTKNLWEPNLIAQCAYNKA